MTRRPEWIPKRKAIPKRLKAEAWEQADGRCQGCGITLHGGDCWRAVVGFEGFYEVSACGLVRTCERMVRHGRSAGRRKVPVKELRPLPHSGGYQQVSLSKAGQMNRRFVHRLVLEAFVGPAAERQVACHNNGNKADNRVINLRWDTQKANIADQLAHGTRRYGSKVPHAKLTEECVCKIRQMCAQGVVQKHIARAFGISPATVSDIATYKTWRRVK